MKRGRLFVISGPSGTGKGTICCALTADGDVELSVSMTTRAPRPGEREGVSYRFVSDAVFRKMIAEDGLLEHAEVFGNLYGTPKAAVYERLDAGRDVILEIDVQGALQVKRNDPASILVFVLPPTLTELRRRITERGSESEAAIDRRMGEALREIRRLVSYDYCVINEDLDEAVEEIAAIMADKRRRMTRAEAESTIRRYEAEGEENVNAPPHQ